MAATLVVPEGERKRRSSGAHRSKVYDVPEGSDEHEYVYFIAGNVKLLDGECPVSENGCYKIGYTAHFPVKQRIPELQTGNPHLLWLIGYWELPKGEGRKKENELHELYSAHRIIYHKPVQRITEWFFFELVLVREVLALPGFRRYMWELMPTAPLASLTSPTSSVPTSPTSPPPAVPVIEIARPITPRPAAKQRSERAASKRAPWWKFWKHIHWS